MDEFWLIIYRSYPDADVEAYRVWANELERLHRAALLADARNYYNDQEAS